MQSGKMELLQDNIAWDKMLMGLMGNIFGGLHVALGMAPFVNQKHFLMVKLTLIAMDLIMFEIPVLLDKSHRSINFILGGVHKSCL